MKSPSELRLRALRRFEQRLHESRTPPAAAADLPRILHELQIHQVELEIQNEELQQGRAALESLLAQYTELYDLAPVAYFSLAADGGILRANVAGAALLGLDQPALTGRPFLGFVAADSRDALAGVLARAGAGASTAVGEVELLHASRRVVHARLEAVADGAGGFRLAVADLTERRRTEAALEASEARYRLLFETARDGLLLVDAATGVVIAANPALCGLLGQPAAAYEGRTLWEIGPLQSEIPSHGMFQERQARGDLRCDQLSIETDDGRQLQVELQSHTYRVARGNVMQVSLRDIGERVKVEGALAEARQHLESAQRLEAIGRLAGGIAHEFNNQLGVIIGYADMLRGHVGLEGPERRKLEQIEKAARHSAELTHELVAFARQQMLEPRRVSPSTLLREGAPLLTHLVGNKVEVAMTFPAVGLVHIDPGQLQGVLIRLLMNARDAMPEGGRLSLETTDVTLAAEEARTVPGLPAGRYVRLTVRDTGSGVDPAVRSRLFEPFSSSKPRAEATGMGLAAAYGTIAQSGGFLFVESEPGQGASFRIYLPRVDAPAGTE